MITNIPVLWRYTKVVGVLSYAGILSVVVLILLIAQRNKMLRSIIVPIAITGNLLLQLSILLYISPQYDSRMDRDDALVFWWQNLFSGVFPYAEPTSLGNPISILPFLHLTALPFILIGEVGYYIVFGVICLTILLKIYYKDALLTYVFAVLVLATAPIVIFEVAGRSELLVNMLFLIAFTFWVQLTVSKLERTCDRSLLLLGIFAGFVAATRIALWPVITIPIIYLFISLSLRQKILFITATSLGFGVLVIPFLLWNPDVFINYAPIGVNSSKLGTRLEYKFLWIMILFVTVVTSSIYAVKSNQLIRACLPVLSCIVLSTWLSFGIDVSYSQLIFTALLFSLPRISNHD